MLQAARSRGVLGLGGERMGRELVREREWGDGRKGGCWERNGRGMGVGLEVTGKVGLTGWGRKGS